jgi:hypothetical protein
MFPISRQNVSFLFYRRKEIWEPFSIHSGLVMVGTAKMLPLCDKWYTLPEKPARLVPKCTRDPKALHAGDAGLRSQLRTKSGTKGSTCVKIQNMLRAAVLTNFFSPNARE